MLPSTFLLSATSILSPAFTLLLAAAWAASNWPLFTASVAFSPAATLVILLPPLFKPALVRLTGLAPPAPVMVTPSLFITVLPVLTLVKPVNSFANWISKVSVPLLTTPMLFWLSFAASVTPPLIPKVVPNLRSTFLPLSPAKINGLFTASFKPFNASPTLLAVVTVPLAGLVML